MSKIRNVSGQDLSVPWLGDRLVVAGQVVDVPAEDVYAYTQQAGWDPADDEAQTLHAAGEEHAEEIEAVVSGEAEEPSGNASREEWATYVVAKGLATEEQLEGLNRNQIRDTYAAEKKEQ